MDTQRDLRRIGDELEIAALLHRYARAVDTKDWDLWRSLFTEDAVIDYGSVGGAVGDRDEVSAWLERSLAQLPMTQHFISNIEVTGLPADTATVRAMFYNPMLLPNATTISACGGYYHHTVVRTGNGWRSKHLREENLWFDNPPSPQLRASLED